MGVTPQSQRVLLILTEAGKEVSMGPQKAAEDSCLLVSQEDLRCLWLSSFRVKQLILGPDCIPLLSLIFGSCMISEHLTHSRLLPPWENGTSQLSVVKRVCLGSEALNFGSDTL